MAGLSNCQKIGLLLWKNWLLQRNAKVATIFEIILPLLVVGFFLLARAFMPSNVVPTTEYKAFDINTLGSLDAAIKSELYYSPENPILENIVKLAAKNLKINGSQSYANALALEKALSDGKILAGIQFDDSWSKLNAYPKNFSFALRFPSELRGKDGKMTWTTDTLFPYKLERGPRNVNDSDGGYPYGYFLEGFVPIQNALTMSYIELVTEKKDLPNVDMQRYPYPSYRTDPLTITLELLPLVIVLSNLYSATCLVKNITTEKEQQLKEVMKIMGLSNWMHWMAWFVKSFIMLGLTISLMVLMLKIEVGDNGAVLTFTNWSVLLIFMLTYVLSSICFCFMMATFFSKANAAAVITGLVWFLTYVPGLFIGITKVKLGTTLAWSLLSNSALCVGISLILKFEITGEGVQWSNLFTPVNVDADLTMGYIICMMLISSVIWFCICLYVEKIAPGEFGVARKWYFIFTAKFWCCKKDNPDDKEVTNEHIERHNPNAFELEPVGQRIGVQVKNLKKKFGKKMVVNGLSVNMYEDEITVLLGHNGAGKTTTISMLVGMFRPTSGTAIINGYDIRTSMDGARMSMGICPQHNVLFDNLTVFQHLQFFTHLKGLKGRSMKREIDKYIKLINLEDKTNVASKKLSGGMKRKLSVCCALVGKTKIVLLDEPSSGLDPSARRQLWDLLQGEKAGRTILLTTHFMDEADVLGDRIAIMCDGELKCHGSSFFLKKKFGSGYRLICVKRNDCKSSNVTAALQKYIPDLRPESDIGAELTYLLPDRYSNQFEKMLSNLENQSDDLKISGYGISISSLEEVFMKMGSENAHEDSVPKQPRTTMKGGIDDNDDVESITSDRLFSQNIHLFKGVKLLCSQWHAMMIKKLLSTYYNIILLSFIIVFTIFLMCLITINRGSSKFSSLKPMTIGLTQYPLAVTVLETAPDVAAGSLQHNISKTYETFATSDGSNYEFVTTGKQNFSSFILDLGQTLQVSINDIYLAAATITNQKITAWLNNEPLHTAPLTVNLVHNAIIKALMDDSYEITVTNAPLPYSTKTILERSTESNESEMLHTGLCLCISFVTAFFLFFVIKERETRYKLLQFVGGLKIWTFWLTQFLWDFVIYILIVVVIMIIIACTKVENLSTFDQLGRFFLVLILFGCSAIPFTYLLSTLFSDPASGFVRVLILNIVFGVMLKQLSGAYKFWEFMYIVEFICGCYPHYSLGVSLSDLTDNESNRNNCHDIEEIAEIVCAMFSQCCKQTPYFDWNKPGILKNIVFLLSIGVISFLLLILLDYRICEKFKQLCYLCNKRLLHRPHPYSYLDDNVADEKRRIRKMSKSELKETNLVLDRVTKYYGRFVAVNELSLCVNAVECFGLLGVNGAGKTTTFKMMTGDEYITYGKAYVKGKHLARNISTVRKETGYCPQFDAIFLDFTGRQNMKIFCLLKGVQKDRIKPTTEELAAAFGFSKYLDVQTKKYSGGNKRKLSTAIAVIGSPSVIYLDEPTSGMDPTARRQLWNMVSRIRDSGKSIILTSHSMEECEALCTRLAIMVNGEFKCIGSKQHLKNKFSKGLVLKIKVKREIDLEPTTTSNNITTLSNTEATQSSQNLETDLANVKDFVAYEFPDAVLQEEYLGMLTYHIPLAVIKWSRIFGIMEKNRESLNIEDYSISQTTLEEIFLEFAKQQKDDERIHSRCCGCCLCCKP